MATVKIYEITTIHLTIYKKFPPLLRIKVDGKTRTGGYTNLRLEPRVYIAPPADGIWEFDFYADTPTGAHTQVITDVSAEYEWDNYPYNELKGIKVYAETNDMTKKLAHLIETELKTKDTTRTATGYSNSLSFDEAFQDAKKKLPPDQADYPDKLVKIKVTEIGGEFGGLHGLSRMVVTIEAN